jgi:hypothetical protein
MILTLREIAGYIGPAGPDEDFDLPADCNMHHGINHLARLAKHRRTDAMRRRALIRPLKIQRRAANGRKRL